MYPPYRPGCRFFFLSAAALLTGLLRFELALLLWGGGFFFLLVYTWIAHLVVRVSVSRTVLSGAEHFDLSLPAEEVYAGREVRAHLRALLPAVILPVFHVTFKTRLSWHTRECVISGSLKPGMNEGFFTFLPAKRGVYTADWTRLIVRDILGFTSSFLAVESRNSLTVLPEDIRPAKLPPRAGDGGELTAVRRAVTRSDELLDARKYYPGDDVRRVNWNMFAHLGELYIRIGEEIPPPNSRILVALDVTTPLGFAPESLEDLLDRAAAAAGGAARAFLEQGREVWLSRSGAEAALRISGGGDAVSGFFAAAWWNGGAIPRPENGPAATCLFSLPGSPGSREFVRTGGRTFVLLPAPPQRTDTGGRRPVRRLFFRDGGKAPGRRTAGPPPGYEKALAEELDMLRRMGEEVDGAAY